MAKQRFSELAIQHLREKHFGNLQSGRMPQIFDNIEQTLLSALSEAMPRYDRADFCVGYFNLRGWRAIGEYVDRYSGGDGNCCRLLIGMNKTPQEELRTALRQSNSEPQMDNSEADRLIEEMAEEFANQLKAGVPTNADEAGLRNLVHQINEGKLVVKLHLRYPLHAKLYLLFRTDPVSPSVGYLGSSNLTMSGLRYQGELNIDVLDRDACSKLSNWFEDRWNDRWCIDISEKLMKIIDKSWARETMIPPYHIYLKIAYHLSKEARSGQSEFRIPDDFKGKLFDFQKAAVQIAAHHLNTRKGVIIGDVVGLGKTLMATALARIFEDDQDLETLIVCPKNLEPMWEDYKQQYRLRAKVLSIGRVQKELVNLRRHRIVIIDESHTLRNKDGKRYQALKRYIEDNDCRCILLSATPYNKSYLDLSNQLRLFVAEDEDLGIRPERMLREISEKKFVGSHQISTRSLAAFEKSEYIEDWRELMRLYLVRRTRSFVQKHYALTDAQSGVKYLRFQDGRQSYFPRRVPKTVKFDVGEQYSKLLDDNVVEVINSLDLPRCGLGNYVQINSETVYTLEEKDIIDGLSRAGKKLTGFNRINLFKRLESSGNAFLLSIERHILRNFIYLHALDNNLMLPIGSVYGGFLDVQTNEDDTDDGLLGDTEGEGDVEYEENLLKYRLQTDEEYRSRAREVYLRMTEQYKHRFRWIGTNIFSPELRRDIENDNHALQDILKRSGGWNSKNDHKLKALRKLIGETHTGEKVLVFTQFADTAEYLKENLEQSGIDNIEVVSGNTDDPTSIARRFSPGSSDKPNIKPDDEVRVLIATDLLSEGQNLQDCAIVVNYDLPWAIIRLAQRVGRVDRIGQSATDIVCYSFMPVAGIEKQLKLRSKIEARLGQNAELVGTDESFFEDEERQAILDLYNEKAGILDGEEDTEVDLSSYAYQIWNEATKNNETLKRSVQELPSVVYSAKSIGCSRSIDEGVLVYLHSTQGHDSLVWMDNKGNNVTENQFEILRAAYCTPDTIAIQRGKHHHDLVNRAVELVSSEANATGGQLGRPSGTRNRLYERLKEYSTSVLQTRNDIATLKKAIDDIYNQPLQGSAEESLSRQLRIGITEDELADLVISLWEGDKLCKSHASPRSVEQVIVCSLGLRSNGDK